MLGGCVSVRVGWFCRYMLDVLGVVCWMVFCEIVVLRWKRFTSVTLEMCRDLMRA